MKEILDQFYDTAELLLTDSILGHTTLFFQIELLENIYCHRSLVFLFHCNSNSFFLLYISKTDIKHKILLKELLKSLLMHILQY